MEHPLVVKIGGSILDALESSWWDALIESCRARKTVLVHGWSRQLHAHQIARGKVPVFLFDKHGHRSRLTNEDVLLDIVRISHTIAAQLTDRIGSTGMTAIAALGPEHDILHAHIKKNLWWVDGRLVPLENRVGPIHKVNQDAVLGLLEHNDVLVISPLATAADGGLVNCDADRAAAAIAGAIGARELVLTTDVDGVCIDGATQGMIVREELPGLAGATRDGMAKKMRAVEEAFCAGVEVVFIGNGTVTDLRTGRCGTQIVRAHNRSSQ